MNGFIFPIITLLLQHIIGFKVIAIKDWNWQGWARGESVFNGDTQCNFLSQV